MYRVTKVLLQPTSGQRRALAELLAVQCVAYNAALEERRGAWRWQHRAVTRFEQFGQVKDLRAVRPDVARFGVTVRRGTLTRVDVAFAAFFGRCQRGERPGCPRFRSLQRFDSVTWPDRSGWRLAERLYVHGVGHVAYRTSRRELRGTPKSLTVVGEGRRWFAAVACEVVRPEPRASTGLAVGVDLGVARLVTSSEGVQVPNPRHLNLARRRLAVEQQSLARKAKGSRRRHAQVQRSGSPLPSSPGLKTQGIDAAPIQPYSNHASPTIPRDLVFRAAGQGSVPARRRTQRGLCRRSTHGRLRGPEGR